MKIFLSLLSSLVSVAFRFGQGPPRTSACDVSSNFKFDKKYFSQNKFKFPISCCFHFEIDVYSHKMDINNPQFINYSPDLHLVLPEMIADELRPVFVRMGEIYRLTYETQDPFQRIMLQLEQMELIERVCNRYLRFCRQMAQQLRGYRIRLIDEMGRDTQPHPPPPANY